VRCLLLYFYVPAAGEVTPWVSASVTERGFKIDISQAEKHFIL
jgi:hypothetical protein